MNQNLRYADCKNPNHKRHIDGECTSGGLHIYGGEPVEVIGSKNSYYDCQKCGKVASMMRCYVVFRVPSSVQARESKKLDIQGQI